MWHWGWSGIQSWYANGTLSSLSEDCINILIIFFCIISIIIFYIVASRLVQSIERAPSSQMVASSSLPFMGLDFSDTSPGGYLPPLSKGVGWEGGWESPSRYLFYMGDRVSCKALKLSELPCHRSHPC